MDAEMPEIPAKEFENRIAKTIAEMKKQKMDFLLVFADREHSANLSFLTNLDPRFEDGLLLLNKNGKRKMLLGNECMGFTGVCPIPMEYEIYQEFSLLGQDRSKSRPLKTIFSDFGISAGSKVGCAFYKYFSPTPNPSPKGRGETWLDIPSYIADVLRNIVEKNGSVVNANSIFMDCENGLRHHTCLEELVRLEWASTRTSESIKNLIRNIKPEIREYELARNFNSDGLPYNCHPMVSSGKKAKSGLSSPSANKIFVGDDFTCAFGVWGALTCRAGKIAESSKSKVQSLKLYEKFWRNYFLTVVTWYESVGIAVSAGDVSKKVNRVRDNSLFDFAVNTGHTIHLDEWTNSPFYLNSKIKLHSGLALQMDIIPMTKGEFACVNMEDGIILADEKLRTEWQRKFPSSWKRIVERRKFMIEKIGIKIKPEVLPLSNIPAYFAPYLLSNKMVAVVD